MAKRQALKQKLKASDRRRRRRQATAISEPTSSTAKPSIDIAGLLADTILEFVDSSGSQVRDVVVVSAMRSYLTASVPSSDHSRVLLDRFHSTANLDGVDMRSFRSGLLQMLELAKQHRDPNDPRNFIQYLGLLTE